MLASPLLKTPSLKDIQWLSLIDFIGIRHPQNCGCYIASANLQKSGGTERINSPSQSINL
jgi:hypothetical protein